MKRKIVGLECKLCGKRVSRSVEEYMEHLMRAHNLEFVDRCEQYFYKKIYKVVE